METKKAPVKKSGAGGRRRQEDFASEIARLNYELQAKTTELKAKTAAENRWKYQATHDPLTGLANILMLNFMTVPSRRKDDPPATAGQAYLMFDIDKFGLVNTTCGHLITNELLKKFAHLLKNSLRDPLFRGEPSEEDESAGRFGGEEFFGILSNTSMREAIAVAERCRLAVQNTPLEVELSKEDARLINKKYKQLLKAWAKAGKQPLLKLNIRSKGKTARLWWYGTVSVGVAHSFKDLSGFPEGEELGMAHQKELKRADTALYHAKDTGRNRTCSTLDLKQADERKRLDHEENVREFVEGIPQALYSTSENAEVEVA